MMLSEHNNLLVVYGSFSTNGKHKKNEDKHSVVIWKKNSKKKKKKKNQILSLDLRTNEEIYSITQFPKKLSFSKRKQILKGKGIIFSDSENSFNNQHKKIVKYQKKHDLISHYLWVVADGHEGQCAAEYVCNNIGKILNKHRFDNNSCQGCVKLNNLTFCENENDFCKDTTDFTSFDDSEEKKINNRIFCVEKINTILNDCYNDLDSNFKIYLDQKKCKNRNFSEMTSGACVTSVLLIDNHLICSSVGDCRTAILTLNEKNMYAKTNKLNLKLVWANSQHRLSLISELKRLNEHHGWQKNNKVYGILEPTRTIGDFDVKSMHSAGVVISNPETRSFSINSPTIVLIATDGIWDFLKANDLIKLLKKKKSLWEKISAWLRDKQYVDQNMLKSISLDIQIFKSPTPDELCHVAEYIVACSRRAGSDDDSTCICIYLSHMQKP